MNATGVFFQQPFQASNVSNKFQSKADNNYLSVFQSMLIDGQRAKDTEDNAMHLADIPPELGEELYQMLLVDENISGETNGQDGLIHFGQKNEFLSKQGIQAQLIWNKLLAASQGNKANEEIDPSKITNKKIQQVVGNISMANIMDSEAIQDQFAQLLEKAEGLLATVTNKQDVMKVASKILEILEKWTALDNKYINREISRQNGVVSTDTKTNEHILWKELVNAFQKRNVLATNQQYNIAAKVTSKDITKWLTSGLVEQGSLENSARSQQAHSSNMPISKLEQYVIHINQNQGSQPIDKQLIDQFQHVLRTSRFLSMNNGINQLSIALRPENLGEMMIRLIETNGEMTLKIIVTSQATKQMLESNIHQLKNMFSPHQVTIEKQETDTQSFHKEQDEFTGDQDQQHSNHPDHEEKQESGNDFETNFHELLLNEKV